MKVEILLPYFSGFYNTIFDIFENIDVAESEFDESFGEITQEEFDSINWKESYKNLSKIVAETAPYLGDLNHSGVTIFPDTAILYSPKAYNYGNDEITVNAEINLIGRQRMIELIDEDLDDVLAFYGEYGVYFETEGDFNRAVMNLIALDRMDEISVINMSIMVDYMVKTDTNFDNDFESREGWIYTIEETIGSPLEILVY